MSVRWVHPGPKPNRRDLMKKNASNAKRARSYRQSRNPGRRDRVVGLLDPRLHAALQAARRAGGEGERAASVKIKWKIKCS